MIEEEHGTLNREINCLRFIAVEMMDLIFCGGFWRFICCISETYDANYIVSSFRSLILIIV